MGIKQAIMKCGGINSDEADELIENAKSELQDHLDNGDMESAEEICMEHFGLELDYLMELI